MKWFEYIIIAVAIVLVALPFILAIRRRKLGKRYCSCECTCKSGCANCPLKNYHKVKSSNNNAVM